MRSRKRSARPTSRRRWLPAGVAVAVAVGLASPAGRRATRRAASMLGRKRRYLTGRARGLVYHLRGRHPSAEVPDVVLAQRIRSTLGPIQKRLDVPHVHVVVCDHVASLHGVVDRSEDAHTIEQMVLHVPGVDEVISHLHIGLGPGDTRPSAGRRDVAAS